MKRRVFVFAVLSAMFLVVALSSSWGIWSSAGNDLLNSTNCPSLLGGTWSGSTCTVVNTAVIPLGATLEVPSGTTLAVDASATSYSVTTYAFCYNEFNAYTVCEGVPTIFNSVNFYSGEIIDRGTLLIDSGGTVVTEGIVYTHDPAGLDYLAGIIYNSGTISNYGTIQTENASNTGLAINNTKTGTIVNSGSIDIQNNGGDYTTGIVNWGNLTNHGTISIDNTGGSNYGINNLGQTINNYGTLTIANSGAQSYGIWGTVDNKPGGNINIGNTGGSSYGIAGSQGLTNNGTITVANTGYASYGLYDNYAITNDGTLSIQNSGQNSEGVFGNAYALTNHGIIMVENTGSGSYGIDGDVITNALGGSITVQNSGSGSYGIYEITNQAFNYGTITVENSAGYGIYTDVYLDNYGTMTVDNSQTNTYGVYVFNGGSTLTNEIGGSITIANSASNAGIYFDGSQFLNLATITIQNTAGTAIVNYGTLLNDGGTITIQNNNNLGTANWGIENLAGITNNPTSKIIIENSQSNSIGLYNVNSAIDNEATITIQNSGGYGIDNSGTGAYIDNGQSTTANITVANTGGIGIYNNQGTIVNYATYGSITLQNSPAGQGINNAGTITNEGIIINHCGSITGSQGSSTGVTIPMNGCTVEFTQTGVPSGTSWGVTVGGTLYSSTVSFVNVSGLSGTVSYQYESPVGTGTQYACSTSTCSGSLSLTNSAIVNATYLLNHELSSSTCSSLLSGTWSGSTCSLTTGYSIGYGQSLEIPSGVTLATSGSGSITIYGTLTVDSGGAIKIGDSGGIYVATATYVQFISQNNEGTIINYGNILTESGVSSGVSNYGNIYNHGAIVVDGTNGLYNSPGDLTAYPVSLSQGFITNLGCGAIAGLGTASGITVPSGGCSIIQSGNWNNPAIWSGTAPLLTVEGGVTIPNGVAVTIPPGVTVSNLGAITVAAGVVINNRGTLNNSVGIIDNGGSVTNYCSSTLIGTVSSNQPASQSCSAQSSSTVTISGGGTSSDQTTTGIDVTITGSSAANGASVTIYTEDLTAPSSNLVAPSSLATTAYYDVNLVGLSDGNARVCITSTSFTSVFTMQYWSGTQWTAASGVTASSTVCGTIPVSSLTGTNIVIGQPTYSVTFSQTGLPSTTTWEVTVDGTLYTTSSPITLSGLYGTLTYQYSNPTNYVCTSSCAGITTLSSSLTITATYQYAILTLSNSVCTSFFPGSWNSATNTCTLSQAITIGTGYTLNIGTGYTITGSSSISSATIVNQGTINNNGTISGTDTGSSNTQAGIWNTGTINNGGTMTGIGGVGYGILNGAGATINNAGTLSGTGSAHGIFNPGTINDYCGTMPSGTLSGNPYNAISCYAVTFPQSGIPTSGANWGVTVSFSPAAGLAFPPVSHSGTGSSILVSLIGTIVYSYNSPVTSSGTTYVCTSSCSGSLSISSAETLATASYITPLSLACSPSPIPVGSPTTCTATVSGNSPTGTITFSTNVGSTTQFSATTCTLSSGSCHVTYTPSASTTPVTISASYSGDTNNVPSANIFSLTVTKAPTTTTVSCSISPVGLGTPTTCTATVSGFSPTGTIIFSTTVGSLSQFSSATCTLSSGSCSVTYSGTTAGSPSISASYGGDINNAPSSNTFALTVTAATTTTTVSCAQSSIFVGSSTICTAAVSGYNPTGTINFSSSPSGTGSFTPSSQCTLSSFSCSVTYSDSTAGSPMITASYSGDVNNAPSSNTLSLTVVFLINTANGATVCPNSPLNGTWNSATNTCTVPTTLTISSGVTLDVGVGVTITGAGANGVSGGSGCNEGNGGVGCNGGNGGNGIDNSGTINNNGTITGAGGSGGNGGTGCVIGYGGAGCIGGTGGNGIDNSGTINNNGTITGNGGNYGNGGTGCTISTGGAGCHEGEAGNGVYNSQGTINNYETMYGSAPFGAAITNYNGIINNIGTMSGTSSTGGTGIENLEGTINNNGTIIGAEDTYGGYGINNFGTINNNGNMNASASGSGCAYGCYGIYNYGTINNNGNMNASASDPSCLTYNLCYGIANYNGDGGTINNAGMIIGTGSTGGIINQAAINNYCGVTPSGTLSGNSYNAISCYTVTFKQVGIPTSGVTWEVTASWSPASGVIFTFDHTGTGASAQVQLVGSLNYTFASSTTYHCRSGCSGSTTLTGNTQFIGSYLPTTTLVCSPASVAAGASSICTATVSNALGSIQGETVSFSSSSTTGVFTATSCLLSSSDSCSVSYKDATSGAPVITASYVGDSNNGASSGSYILANFASQITAASSTVTLSGSPTITANQTTLTQVSIAISGSSGDFATVFSADFGTTQPSGTGTTALVDLLYFDMKVSGITDGTANVCVSSASVRATTSIQYYSGTSWLNASNIVVTSGVSACGNVPVSTLTGTYFLLGLVPVPPTTSLLFTPNGLNGWFNSTTADGIVSASSSDGTISTFSCTVDSSSATLSALTGIGTSSASATVTVTGDSTGHSVSCTATDDYGKTSSPATATVMIESTPLGSPTVSLSPGSPSGLNDWYTGSVSAVVTHPSETISRGVSCTQPTSATSSGTGLSFTSTCKDSAGQTSSGTSQTFNLEATGPVVIITTTTSPNSYGWYNSMVTFDITGTSISGVCSATTSYSGPDSATAFVTGSCTDPAGLTGSNSIGIKYDSTVPSVTVTPNTTPTGSNGWYNATVSFQVSGVDSTSGIESCSSIPNYSGPDSSTATVSATCTSVAGKTGSNSYDFKYDSTPPTISDLFTPNGQSGWFKGISASGTISSSDSISGLATVTCNFGSLMGSLGTQTLTFGTQGKYSTTCTATDNAGDSRSVAFSVNLETTGPGTPTISLNPGSPNGNNGWYTGSVSFVIVPPTNTISGAVSCTPIASYSGSSSSSVSLSTTCTDPAGLSSTGSSPFFKFESTGPSLPVVSPMTSSNTNGWYATSVSFMVQAPANTFSGTVTCTTPLDYTGPSSQTATSLASTCTDPAGLTSSGVSSTFKFEATSDGPLAPTISLASTLTDNSVYLGSASFTIAPPTETFSGGVSCTPIPAYSGPNGEGLIFSSTCTDYAGLISKGNSQAFNFETSPPTISASPSTIDSGQTATITAIASEGSGAYSGYAFYSGGVCSGSYVQSGSSDSYAAVLTSTTTYCVLVTDSFGATAHTTVTVTVEPALSSVTFGSFAINPQAPGASDNMTVSWSGGTPNYIAKLYYSASSCSASSTLASQSSAVASSPITLSFTTPSTTGSYQYCVVISDSVGGAVTAQSSATFQVAANVVSSSVSNGQISGGKVSSNQTSSTGVSVNITGSSAASGTTATITTQVLNSSNSNVGQITLGNSKYYDVKIGGITDGAANICIVDPLANPGTMMKYWNGSAWASAANVQVSGTKVCGDIPVSSLTGTNIVLGNAIPTPTNTYSVTFNELGLPPGTFWSATFDGDTLSSTSNSLSIYPFASGTYSWNATTSIPGGNGVRYAVMTASGTVTLPSKAGVTINFVTQYLVGISSAPNNAGTTLPQGSSWYDAGSTLQVVASSASGYVFSDWTVNGSISPSDAQSSQTSAVINGPGTITANFATTTSTTSTTSSTSTSTTSSTVTSTTTSTVTNSGSSTTTSTSSSSSVSSSTTRSEQSTSSTTASSKNESSVSLYSLPIALVILLVIVMGGILILMRKHRR